MNLILLHPDDFISDSRVRLQGRRWQHIVAVHQPEAGQSLTVGLLNGDTGKGQVVYISQDCIELDVSLDTPPPPSLPVILLLALPRPKMMKRVLQTVSAMGVKKLVLINSYRVEKSYWQSPLLSEASIRENLILGLEQAKDTRLPEVSLYKRFKPFVEDELPDLVADSTSLIAHPGIGTACPQSIEGTVTLAVGPEGGFIPYEVDKLLEQGFQPIHLGPRILRVETAIPVLLAKLF